MIYYQNMKSPVGKLLVAGNEKGLYLINFPRNDNPSLPGHEWEENPKPLQEVLSQLEAYFAGKLKAFSPGHLFERDTVSKKSAYSPSSCSIWTDHFIWRTGQKIGNPKASRAVGQANARNPIPIVIPCHRVIGSNEKLTGFGGGIEVKQALLDLEQLYQ